MPSDRPLSHRTPAPPDPRLLEGLGGDGQRFFEAVWTDYELTMAEACILRLGAEALDDSVTARADGDVKSARASVRQLLAVLGRLGLPASDRWTP